MSKAEAVEVEEVGEEMSQEQAADFARLQGMANEGEQAQAEQAEAFAGVDAVEAVAGFLTVGGLAFGWVGYRRVAELWNPETCRGVAEKAVPVLEKYPWGIRALEFLQTGAGVEEIALAMYCAPLALATMRAASLDSAEMRKDKKPEKQPGQKQEETAPIEGEAQAVEDAGMGWAG